MIASSQLLSRSIAVVLLGIAVAWLAYGIDWHQLLGSGTAKVVAEPEVVPVTFFLSDLTDEDGWVEVTVSLRNVAQHSVRVVGAQSSCGCISTTDEYPFTLTPDERKNLHFRVHLNESVKQDEIIGNVVFFLNEASPVVEVVFQAHLSHVGDVPPKATEAAS